MKDSDAVAYNRLLDGLTVVPDDEAIHPIQIVARRTGLSTDVIRAWERRYEAVRPERSETSRRLYTNADIRRLLLLNKAIKGGRRIGDVAQLSEVELEAMLVSDHTVLETASKSATAAKPFAVLADEHWQAALDAAQRLDAVALENALLAAAVGLSVPVLLEDVVYRLMSEIGERWRAGTMRLCHEHMATAVVRSFLGSMISSSHMVAGSGPTILVTTPSGQCHELGALMAAVTAAARGWDPVYLGANTPPEEIAFAFGQRAARAVALSICYPADDPALPSKLRLLRRYLPTGSVVLVGGQAASGYWRVLDEIEAIFLAKLDVLAAELDQLRELG